MTELAHRRQRCHAASSRLGLGRGSRRDAGFNRLRTAKKSKGRVSLPTVALIAGYAGSGKTKLGKVLAKTMSWALLDKDTLTRPLLERAAELVCGDPHDRHTPRYVAELRPLEYECLMRTAWEVLDHGTSVLVTAPFLAEVVSPEWLDQVRFRCEVDNHRLHVVWVDCDIDSMKDRLTARGADRDRWKLGHWEEFAQSVHLDTRPAGEHDVVNNSSSAPTGLHQQALRLATLLQQ